MSTGSSPTCVQIRPLCLHRRWNRRERFIAADYSDKSMPEKPNAYKTKAKVAQEAHEAIRPASFAVRPNQASQKFKKIDEGGEKLYRLIWQRAMASQMVPAKLENVGVTVIHELKSAELLFKSNGQRILEPGYLAAYPEKVSELILPKLTEGQELFPRKVLTTQHFTQPPGRYSEASLIKELEKYGIGRPSTYAPIINTIQVRKYIEKEGRALIPTDTGIVVIRLLEKYFPDIVDKDFTAEMEEGLDKIADGKLDWVKYMSDFYEPFAKDLEKKRIQNFKRRIHSLGRCSQGHQMPRMW